MPDWITHIIFAYLIAVLLSGKLEKKSLIMLGALLPDILTKFSVLFKFFLTSQQLSVFDMFHTPVGAMLIGLAIAPLFKFEYKKTIISFAIGIGSHFLLDAFQGPVGYMVFWPFSWNLYKIGIIWSENMLPLVLLSSLFLIYLIVSGKFRKIPVIGYLFRKGKK